MPIAYTDTAPKRCPICSGRVAYQRGLGLSCLSCGSILSVESVTVPAVPAPTEADRLRDLLRRAFPVLHYYGTPPGEQHVNASPPHREVVALVLEVRAALEGPPLAPEPPATPSVPGYPPPGRNCS